jgi:hypothetical protein
VLTEGHVPGDTSELADAQFSEQELANLTFAIVAINGANRMPRHPDSSGSHRVRPRGSAKYCCRTCSLPSVGEIAVFNRYFRLLHLLLP